MNIIDNILFQCAVQPRAPALCAPGRGIGLVSYGRLAQMIGAISHRLGQSGVGAGQTVAVSIEDPIVETAVLLALTRLGVVTVSRFDEQIRDLIGVDALVADKIPTLMLVEKVILVDLSWTRGGQDAVPAASATPDSTCRIILTSGTTGLPKAVAVSHALLSARIARHISVFGVQVLQATRVFSDAPLATSLGFQFLIFTLWRGGLFLFPGKSFDDTIDAIEAYQVGCCLSSPGGLESLVRWFERYPALQSEFEVIVSAGDVLSKSLIDRVRSRICPLLINVYGSTEASMTATAPVHLIEDTQGAVGFVNPATEIEIVDDRGALVPAGSQGLLRIRSPFAVDRYHENPTASASVFRDGWFHPGDIGTLEPDGLLRIAGRNDALLNLGGDKISPESLEAVITSFADVIECAVFAADNDVGKKEVFAAIVANGAMDEAKLQAHCTEHLAPQFMPAKFIRVDQLPRSPMGKIDRSALVNLFNEDR